MKHVLIMAVAGWAVCLALTAAYCIPKPAGADADRPEKPSVVAAVYGKPEPPQEGEDPDEAALIEAALVAQGYFRADVPLSYELQDALHTACARHGVPYPLALGLIQVESGFDPEVVNPATGCYGLAQLNPEYFPEGLTAAENIDAGMEYLGGLLERYGDTAAALTAYHDGHDTGRRGYADAVLDAAEEGKGGP